MIPQTESSKVTYRPLGQLCKITTRSGKFERKFSKDDQIVYNYFFWKLKFYWTKGSLDQFCIHNNPWEPLVYFFNFPVK